MRVPTRRALAVALTAALSAAAAGVSLAQEPWERWGQFRGFRRVPPRFPTEKDFDGRFLFCRVMYQGGPYREPGGQGWSTDYPTADLNLPLRLSQLTKMPVSFDERGEPNHVVVRPIDAALFRCPFTLLSDAGTVWFSEADAAALRDYLLKGGFLWVDDFWGTHAWQQWSSEIGRVLPEGRIVDVPLEHPIRRAMFQIDRIPQVTSINFWRGNGGNTSERGPDSPHANLRMIADEKGRIMVLMTHNTDISDAWEREGEEYEFFYRFSVDGYALGINVVLYAMAH